MNPPISHAPSHPVVRRTNARWRHMACAGALALAGLYGTPGFSQTPPGATPAPNPVVTATPTPPAPAVVQQGLAGSASGSGGAANPYGLRVVWEQGDLVSRTTLVLLTLMSLLSWYVIVAKLLAQRQQAAQAQAARLAFANADSLGNGAAAVAKGSPFGVIVDSAMSALRVHERLAGQVDVGTWLSQDIVRNVSTLQMRMQSGLSVLATIGSTAPFVGLFGTVWGIYNALLTIGSTGQASIDKVAGPVGEALIMTALGLAVAVPAVLGYNWLVRRNRLALHSVKGFGSDLHTLLLIDIEKNQRIKAAGRSSN